MMKWVNPLFLNAFAIFTTSVRECFLFLEFIILKFSLRDDS